MANFIATVHKEDKSDFGVSFPDFPGCVTAGKDIDEAKDMAQDALALHIRGMLEDGEPMPTPSRLEDIMIDPEYADAAAYLVVSVPDAKPRTSSSQYHPSGNDLEANRRLRKKNAECPGLRLWHMPPRRLSILTIRKRFWENKS